MFGIPDHPDYLFRRHALRVMEISSPKHVLDLISASLHHYARLEQAGIVVPRHRHVDAQLPVPFVAQEGRVLSVVPRLPLTPLNPRNPEHLPAALHTLRGLTRYMIGLMEDRRPDLLWDVFGAEQHGLQGLGLEEAPPTPQGVILHDFGMEIAAFYTPSGLDDAGDRCGVGMARLHALANTAARTALGTEYEPAAREIGSLVASEVPSVR